MSATWPPDPVATVPTLTKNSYHRGDIATLEWEYSPAPDIDYNLTYYPQPSGSPQDEIVVTYAEIKDHSGPPADNGLRPAVYNTIPLTNDVVPFVLTATCQGESRTYTTIATVN